MLLRRELRLLVLPLLVACGSGEEAGPAPDTSLAASASDSAPLAEDTARPPAGDATMPVMSSPTATTTNTTTDPTGPEPGPSAVSPTPEPTPEPMMTGGAAGAGGSGDPMAAGGGGAQGTGGGSGAGGAEPGSGGLPGGGGTGGGSGGGAGGGLPTGTMCVAPDEAESLADFYMPTRPPEEQCAYCHGPAGEGGDLGPPLGYPYEDFYTWVIRNGRVHPDFEDEMPAFTEEEFGEDCLQGVFGFLGGRPKPTTGEGLYMEYCANCHGDDGSGGVTGRPIAQEPAEEHVEHSRAGAHLNEFDNRPEYMPAIGPELLSDEEIGLIADYLSSL